MNLSFVQKSFVHALRQDFPSEVVDLNLAAWTPMP